MRYKLFQIKDWENNSYVFRSFDSIRNKKNGFSFTDYELVYEGEIDDNEINFVLEELFVLFNLSDRPEGFKGRSMSVSDIVELDGEYYYCDIFGFKKITDFCS